MRVCQLKKEQISNKSQGSIPKWNKKPFKMHLFTQNKQDLNYTPCLYTINNREKHNLEMTEENEEEESKSLNLQIDHILILLESTKHKTQQLVDYHPTINIFNNKQNNLHMHQIKPTPPQTNKYIENMTEELMKNLPPRPSTNSMPKTTKATRNTRRYILTEVLTPVPQYAAFYNRGQTFSGTPIIASSTHTPFPLQTNPNVNSQHIHNPRNIYEGRNVRSPRIINNYTVRRKFNSPSPKPHTKSLYTDVTFNTEVPNTPNIQFEEKICEQYQNMNGSNNYGKKSSKLFKSVGKKLKLSLNMENRPITQGNGHSMVERSKIYIRPNTTKHQNASNSVKFGNRKIMNKLKQELDHHHLLMANNSFITNSHIRSNINAFKLEHGVKNERSYICGSRNASKFLTVQGRNNKHYYHPKKLVSTQPNNN